jgi:transcription factor 1
MEFFPNVPCALLDIQPKTMHPLLLESGPNTSRAGDVFGILLGSMYRNSLDPLDKVLESIYPGAAEGVLPHCPSLVDPKTGGAGYSGWSGLSPRALNEKQLVEVLDAWMKWPFRPGFSELVGRGSEDGDYAGDEEGGAVQTGDF